MTQAFYLLLDATVAPGITVVHVAHPGVYVRRLIRLHQTPFISF